MSDMPKFETYEELQEWLEQQKVTREEEAKEKAGAVAKKATKNKKANKARRPKKPSIADEGAKHFEDIPPESVWSTVHFYTQPGDNIARTRNDAKEEKSFRNDNVLVFYHDHLFGSECVRTCGGV